MTTKRQTKPGLDSDKPSIARKARRSGAKSSSGTNGKNPLASYEHALIGIVECSPDGTHINVNEEFCHLVGYEKEELIGKSLKEITHEDDYPIDIKLHQQLVEGKIPFYRLEKRYLHKNGGTIWAELTRSVIRDVSGNPLYTIGVVLDISDRKQVERVLRDSSERLRLATEAARMFTWELDFKTQIYTFADNFEQVLGFSGGLLPKNSMETVERLSPAEDVRSFWDAFAKATAYHSDLHSFQYRMLNPENGQVVWLEANAKIVYDDNGNPERMFGVAQNITENKRTQQEILIISRMPEENPHPVMRLTREGKVLYANNSSAALLKSWEGNAAHAIPDELQARVAETFTSGMKKEVEIENDGKVFSATLAPILEAGYVNFYGNDVTERKRAEQALQEFARQQEALYQLTDQLHRTNSLDDLFNAALDAILSALQCDRASILLFDDKDVMRFVAWHDLSDDYRMATNGHSPWKSDEKNPEPICMDDVNTADLSDSLRAVIKDEGIGALAFIPLVANGKLIGKFMTYYNAPHAFREDEIEFSLTMARQLAFGVDRKRVEEALARERELLKRLFETMPAMLTIYDPSTGLQQLNGQFERLTGWKNGISILSLLEGCYPDPEYRKEVIRRMAACAPNEWVDVQMRTRDGRTLDTTWSNINFSNGMQVGIGIDITERKRAEQRLVLLSEISELVRKSEDPNELLFAVSKAVGEYLQVRRCLFNEIDVENDIEIVHRDYCRGVESVAGLHKISDYSSVTSTEMAAGKTVINYDSKTDPRTAPDYERSYVQYGERAYVTVPLMRENRWVASLWVNDDMPRQWSKEDVSLLETIAERTWLAVEKLRINTALRESEALYRTIARSIPGGGIYVVDKDMRYLVADGAVTEAFGFSREMLEGHTVSEVFHDEQRSRMIERLKRNFAGETISYETEHNGRIYWTQQAPLLESTGQTIIVTLDITERKQMEEALRQSEERFSQFMQHLPGLAWIKDRQGRYVYANAAAEAAFRTPLVKLYGKTDEDIFPPEFANQFKKNDDLALQDEKGVQVVETLEHKDGILHYSLVNKFPIPGPYGDIALIGGTAFDITERRQAEEALRGSEERYRTLFESIDEGFCIIEKVEDEVGEKLDFLYVEANPAFADQAGLGGVIGKTIRQAFPGEPEEWFETYDHILRTGEPMRFERGLITQGRILELYAFRVEDGTNRRVAVVFNDVTERRQAEEALRESEQRYRNLFDLVPVAVYTCDANGLIQEYNHRAVELWGREPAKNDPDEKFCGSFKIYYPDGRFMPHENCPMARMLKGETLEPHELEIVVERPDGFRRSVIAHPLPIRNARGEIVEAINCLYDITERKQAEEALQSLNLQLETRVVMRTTELQEANTALQESQRRLQMLSQRLVEVQEEERRAIARELHDRVGQSLSALNINLIIMRDQLLPDSLERVASRLSDSMHLVGETITLVRDVMSNLRPAVLDDYGLEAALQSYVDEYMSRYGIKVVLEKPARPIPRLGPSIEMTFLRIAQEALMNIARHANASQVTLSLWQEGDSVSMTVQDNGSGIVSWQEANRPGSHGLTIMRERAEAFGGNLKVGSVPGKGTKVEMSIPIGKGSQNEAQKEMLE
jgi:PAS domain S-box-containing protein